MRPARLAPFVLASVLGGLLGACAEKETQPPAELTEFTSTADIERVWSASLPGNDARLRLGLGVATAGQSIFAASYGGAVVAFNAADGKRLWRTETKLKLTGGPGAGENLVVVGGNAGDVVALDATTGEIRWRSRINSEILSAPYIARATVLLRTVDGRLVAMRASDGSHVWSAEEEVPRLSLRGTSRPLITGDLAIAGFDNGRVLGLQLADGASRWEINVAPPAGRSELERLVDIDSALLAMGSNVYVVTYQGRAASLDSQTGDAVWTREISSYSGLALDEEGVYTTTSDGAVVKLDRLRNGVEIWRQDALSRRRLSPPAVLGPLVAVADLQGYVHFLDKSTGALAARLRPLGNRVTEPPVVVDDLVVLVDADGKIAALRIKAVGEAASGTRVKGSSGSDSSGGAMPSNRTPSRSRPGPSP